MPSAAQPPGMGIPTARPLPTLPPSASFPTARPSVAPENTRTPAPQKSPAAGAGKPTPAGTPVAGASPSPSPLATPSAFAQANVFVYGSPPPSTYANPGDAPQIFYAMLSPTVLTPNTTVRVNAITTTNVQKLTIGVGGTTIGLSPLGSGRWQGVFSANALGLPPTATQLQLALVAARSDGQSATIQLPISLMRAEQPL